MSRSFLLSIVVALFALCIVRTTAVAKDIFSPSMEDAAIRSVGHVSSYWNLSDTIVRQAWHTVLSFRLDARHSKRATIDRESVDFLYQFYDRCICGSEAAMRHMLPSKVPWETRSNFFLFMCLFLYDNVEAIRGPPTISAFPYLETFDTGVSLCADCSTGGLETDCLVIEPEAGWIQDIGAEDTANTNWLVWQGIAPTPGTGPKTGDHTWGFGQYLWVHQGTGRSANCDDDDGAPYCEATPTAFVGQTVGIQSPLFDFSGVSPTTDNIFLRFWYWMHGLRTGTLTVQLSTTGGAPWTTNLTTIAVDEPRWKESVVPLTGMQGQSTVRLRFVAEFLPTYCPSGSPFCIYCGTSPHPDDMADQAFDDVEVFLSSSAPPVAPGSEDRAIWVDLSGRYPSLGSAAAASPYATDHQGMWWDVATALGAHTMITWGGISATGEVIDRTRVLDYVNRAFTLDSPTGQVPIPRRRGAFATLGGTNATDPRMLIYGGRGKFGISSALLTLDPLTGTFDPSQAATGFNCTDISTPAGEPSHLRFPCEGSRAVFDPQDPNLLYVTLGRSLVVQVNFVTRFNLSSGLCEAESLRPSSGPAPPLARWDHTVTAWNNGVQTYLAVFGGRFQPSDSDAPRVLNDFRLFDVANTQWLDALLVVNPTQKPSPRSGAAAATNKQGNKMVLYGGIDDDTTSSSTPPQIYGDVYVLQYDLQFELWKRLSPGLDVNSVPGGRWGHLMLPMFFSDTTLDPLAPATENSEGFMIHGGTLAGGQVTNHLAKLHFGNLDLTPLATGDDDGDDPTVAIVLGVLLPFCCLFLLLMLLLALAISILITWRAATKRRLQRRYGIGQQDIPSSTSPSPSSNSTPMDTF